MNPKNRVDVFINNPRKAVWTLALPIMFGMAIQTIYSIVDMIFVGRLGGEAIAALTFNMPLVFFSIGITFGIGTGATSVIAQFLGAKNKKEADNTAEHTVAIGIMMAIVISLAGYFFRYHIFSFLGTPENIIHLATDYFSVIVTGFIFTILNVFFRSILTGEGDTKTPIYFQTVGTVMNIILDPIFIFKFGLGVKGAALATVISQALVTAMFFWFLFIKKG
ncbi:MAG: MATE family efflux transporter, partial [Candidatus Marinimicrobia bacterium]|nr:MATE family efflux transporter [Candidatus Neomarinimicrobiota bacterium]